jgi:hypothetical protein
MEKLPSLEITNGVDVNICESEKDADSTTDTFGANTKYTPAKLTKVRNPLQKPFRIFETLLGCSPFPAGVWSCRVGGVSFGSSGGSFVLAFACLFIRLLRLLMFRCSSARSIARRQGHVARIAASA